jgi:hypothetical protein
MVYVEINFREKILTTEGTFVDGYRQSMTSQNFRSFLG